MTNTLEVDVTALVIDILTSAALATVDARTPDKLEQHLPFIRVVRTGGPNDGVRLDFATVVLHSFAASDQGANSLLYQAGTTLRQAVGAVRDGAVITQLRTLGGPGLVDYENPDVSHAFMTVQVRVKTA